MMGDTPLFQLQGNEYYCPTCEKIMKSGYNLEQSAEFYNQVINATKEGVSFEEALESIKPLLVLLPSKYYIVLDTSLYPTDGNGNLFWETPNEEQELPGTCIYYFQEKGYTWGKLRPYFTVGTQPVKKLSRERVEYYSQKEGARAIAYYMDGYVTALLDGHHKAMAAALKGQKVDALVIIPCYESIRCMGEVKSRVIGMGGMKFSCEEYGLTASENNGQNKLNKEEQWVEIRKILSQIPQAPIKSELPYDTKELVRQYPDVRTVAYMDLVGEITGERIERILTGQEVLLPEQITDLLEAMSGLRHERLWEVADFFMDRYRNIREVILTCFEVLTRLPRTEKLDTYLIDKMVEFEDEYPIIKGYVMGYF